MRLLKQQLCKLINEVLLFECKFRFEHSRVVRQLLNINEEASSVLKSFSDLREFTLRIRFCRAFGLLIEQKCVNCIPGVRDEYQSRLFLVTCNLS